MPPGVLVALDVDSRAAALTLAQRLDPAHCGVKVGLELFTSAGSEVVYALGELGFSIFLDLKLHDIPRTVARACRSIARLPVSMMTVHTLGGRAMVEAARDALDGHAHPPQLLAVTALTSLDDRELSALGLGLPPFASLVVQLGTVARQWGADGLVCATGDAPLVRAELADRGGAGTLVTPGIRLAAPAVPPAGDDQRRVGTPEAAAEAGVDFIVVGRAVTEATDPVATLEVVRARLARARPAE